VLRADNNRITIGPGSNIQDGCIVHVDNPAAIGRDVSVGHRAVLHGCSIGDAVLIGMGAVVMNDSFIGAGSRAGAGAVIAAGTDIPPRSLVLGVPGRVPGSVTDEQLSGNHRNASEYYDLAREFCSAN
jgi:carbonic anhydrase/acetyltransferase-like protein (isoleucine patch superfamily)